MKKTIAVLLMLITVFMSLAPMVVAEEIFPDLIIQVFDEKGRPVKDKDTKEFVYENHWATKDIMKSTKIGLIVGYEEEDGTFVFKPEQSISRAEFIKMAMILSTNRTFDFDTIPTNLNHWAGKYVKVAEMQNVIEKGKYTEKNLDVFRTCTAYS